MWRFPEETLFVQGKNMDAIKWKLLNLMVYGTSVYCVHCPFLSSMPLLHKWWNSPWWKFTRGGRVPFIYPILDLWHLFPVWSIHRSKTFSILIPISQWWDTFRKCKWLPRDIIYASRRPRWRAIMNFNLILLTCKITTRRFSRQPLWCQSNYLLREGTVTCCSRRRLVGLV